MRNFVIGQYVKGNSYIYKIDPRAKIVALLIMMVSVFFLKDIYLILGFLGLIVLIFITARVSIIKALMGLKPLVVLMLFIFAIQIFINRNGVTLYQTDLSISILSIAVSSVLLLTYFFTMRFIKFKVLYFLVILGLIFISFKYIPSIPKEIYLYSFEVYYDGLMTSIYVLVRLISILMLSMLLTISTTPSDLTLAIEWLFKPLKIFKINSEEIALIITIAIRYIPTITDEAFRIMDAQASRGADYKNSGIFKKLGQLVSLLVPMFVLSFERSEELAGAMISRNFVPGKKKTHYHNLKFRFGDLIALVFSLSILGGSICVFILL